MNFRVVKFNDLYQLNIANYCQPAGIDNRLIIFWHF